MLIKNQLSEHYTLEDFTFSEVASRFGIDNTPPGSFMTNILECAYMLEDVQRDLGYYVPTIIRGYSCPEVNTRTGGSLDSDHMRGLAVDILCPGFGSALELCERIAGIATVNYDQIIYEYRSWVHISVGPRKRRMQLTKVHGAPLKIGFV